MTARLQLPHLEIFFRKVLSSHSLFWFDLPLTDPPSILTSALASSYKLTFHFHYSSQQVLSSTSHQCVGCLTWLAPMFVFFKLSWLKIRTKKLGIQYLAQSNFIFRTLFWAPQLQLFPTLIKSASESLVVELLVHFMAHPIDWKVGIYHHFSAVTLSVASVGRSMSSWISKSHYNLQQIGHLKANNLPGNSTNQHKAFHIS